MILPGHLHCSVMLYWPKATVFAMPRRFAAVSPCMEHVPCVFSHTIMHAWGKCCAAGVSHAFFPAQFCMPRGAIVPLV